jgi:hypothetical protein
MRVLRAVFFVGLLLAPAVALAGKAEGVERLLAEGKCAEVVAKVDEWEGRGALGDEAAHLAGLRIDGALCVARATDTLAAWSTFLARFPASTPAAAARVRVGELAFAAAQAEGTSDAMRSFVEKYPSAPQVGEAQKQAEAWDFDDASRAGTPEAIRAFLARYPRSSLREAAWESVVQKNSGVYLITEGGEPRLLEALPVDGDRITMPVGLPGAGAHPLVAVNMPGAGVGITSEWWSLQAVAYDEEGNARLSPVAPVARELAARVGGEPPGPEANLMTLVRAPGEHIARVATTRAPLALPGHCTGSGRFAFVLASPGLPARAFPFSVPCPEKLDVESPLAALFAFLDAVDAGDRTLARQLWGSLLESPAASPLRGWLAMALGGDPWEALVERRAAVGDWVVWSTQPDGSLLSSWLRADEAGARVLAVRPGWAVVANGALRTTVGVPACSRVVGSLGANLFCAGNDTPEVLSLEGTPVAVPEPSAAELTAANVSTPLPAGAVVAAGPRWQASTLCIFWRIRAGAQRDVLAPAPEPWVEALAPTAALGRWLSENAGSGAFGAARVDRNAASLYAAFTSG